MRLKHNKKRNTAFVYEALVRELTESVVKNNKNKQNKVVSIIKEHFGNRSLLKQELDLYKSIYETRDIEKSTAEKIVYQVKERHESLDKKKLFQEQSALINKINRTLSAKLYGNFVPNYKTIASVYSIFQETLPVKDRVLLEENIIDQMSASLEIKPETQQPIDSLVYNTFVSKYNEEYSGTLTEHQSRLLNTYISSFSDNDLSLKIYLNEEIGRLKEEIVSVKQQMSSEENTDLVSKLQEVYDILQDSKDKEIDTHMLEMILNTQSLISEIKKNDD